MSSPIARRDKGFLDRILISIHKKTTHSKRVNSLTTLFVGAIKSLNPENKKLNLLDVGCGDMAIAKNLASRIKNLQYTCIDIYPNVEHWNNYYEFDGKNIPFHEKEFDLVLFSDVLHHGYDNIKILLIEAKRVSDIIIIKDHFEYGFWSRRILQLADFIGNYGYGVSVPKRYFTKQSFLSLLVDCKLKEIKQLCPVQVYKKTSFINLLFKSKYQFLSIVQ